MKNRTPYTASTSVDKPPVGPHIRSRVAAFCVAFVAASIFALASPSAIAQGKKSAEKEFKELSESRKERKQLVDFLIKKGHVKEAPNGTLAPQKNADADAKKVIAEENKSRLRMFEMIAKAEKKSPDVVGREFHKKLNGLPNKAKPAPVVAKATTKKLLTLRGSASIGNSLAPELAAAYLKEKGYKNVKVASGKITDGAKITGIDPKRSNVTAVVEIVSGSSATAFGQSGLLGKSCDIGMATRQPNALEVEKMILEGLGDPREPAREIPFAMDALTVIVHPDNPTNALSVLDVARLYAGYHREWSSVNGGDCNFGVIDLYAREESSGQWSNFQKLVMKPYKKEMATEFSERFVDNADIVQNVLSNPSGLGIVAISDINPKLKVLKIKPHARGPERLPTAGDMEGGNYPLAHQLYFYLPAKANPIAREFIDFSVGAKGQAIVDDSRMVALSPVKREAVQKEIAKAKAEPQPILVARPIKVKPVETAPTVAMVSPKEQPAPSATPAPAAKIIEMPEEKIEPKVPVSTQPPVTSEETKVAYELLIKGANRKHSEADLNFKSSYGSTLKTDSRERFEKIVDALKKPENANAKVVVIGFSDSRGSEYKNLKLSKERAAGVAKLFARSGIKNVVHDGFGEAMPATSNMLAEGRDQNRRVEIWIQH